MFAHSSSPNILKITMHTELAFVDRCIERIRAYLDESHHAEFFFAVALLSREALNNAMIHGNKLQPDKTVTFELGTIPNGLRVRIEDQGQGFDWRAHLERQSDLSRENGRGHEIYTHYASAVSYNDQGNSVTLDITQP